MPTLEFETTIAVPLQRIWDFHAAPLANLPALCRPEQQARVESADMPIQQGSRVTVSAIGPFGRRIVMTVRITEHRPPHTVVFGEEARFVDEQESGPFAFWRHEHDFEAIDSKTTRITDRVTYRLPVGPLGWLADLLFIRRQIRALFRHRHAATARALET